MHVARESLGSRWLASHCWPELRRPAASAGAARVVLAPHSGAHVRGNTVRIVVPAGNEWNDVVARLNGVSLGREFARVGKGRRVLRAPASHSLRHGRNVLRVRARSGGPSAAPSSASVWCAHFTSSGASPPAWPSACSATRVPLTVRHGRQAEGREFG
jgi:hypothetical protein